MIANPEMVAKFAEEAGIAVPSTEDWTIQEFPHWFVFLHFTIGRPIDWHSFVETTEHNARVISAIPREDFNRLSLIDIQDTFDIRGLGIR